MKMCKRILSLVLLLCLAVPVMSGAAADLSYEIVLYDSVLDLETGFTFARLDGTVQVAGTSSLISVLDGEFLRDPHTGTTCEIHSNYFYIDVFSNEAGTYELEPVLSERIGMAGGEYFLDLNGDGLRDAGEGTISMPSYSVIPAVQINESLDFNSSTASGFVTITGSAPDAAGWDIGIRYAEEAFLSTYEIDDKGTFGFMIAAAELDHGGTLEVVLETRGEDAGTGVTDGVVVRTGTVDAMDLNLTVQPGAFSEGILHTNPKVIVDGLPSSYLNGEQLVSGFEFRTKLYDDDAEITEAGGEAMLVSGGESRLLEYSPFNLDALKELEPGSYRVETVLWEGSYRIADGSATLSVLAAAEDTMVGMDLLEGLKSSELVLDFGGQDAITSQDDLVFYESGVPVSMTNGGYVLKYYAPGQSQQIVHTLQTRDVGGSAYPTLLPAGLQTKQFLGEGETRAVIPLYQGGEFQYSIEVYMLEGGYYRQVYSDSGVFTAASYLVDIEEEIMFTGEPLDQVVTVREYDGTPVNNAIIYYGRGIYDVSNPQNRRTSTSGLNEDGIYEGEKAYLYVNNATTNIVGGQYPREDWELEGSGTINFVVYKMNADSTATRMAVVEDGVAILGSDVWSVTVDKTVASPGQEQTYYLQVRDDSGRLVTPDVIDIFEDGIGRRTIGSIEINANVTNDGIRIIHTCQGTTTDEIVFRAGNAVGTQTGEAVVTVAASQINFSNGTASRLTENFAVPLAFSVINPLDGSPLETDLSYEFVNLGTGATGILTARDSGNRVIGSTIEGEESYGLVAKVYDLNHDEIDYAGVMPALRIYLGNQGDGSDQLLAEIPVGQASLTSDPESLSGGLSAVTLTYRDADGNPLSDRLITVNGVNAGSTDDIGEFDYATVSTVTLNFFAQTDVADVYTELIVKYDSSGSSGGNTNGVVSAPRTVTVPSVTISVNNPYPMHKLQIGDIEEDFFIPVQTYSTQVSDLQPGENIVNVQILDSRYLVFTYEVKIFYDAPIEPVVLQIGVENAFGTPTILLGTTMVPVRFVEQLGATLLWDGETKTATYIRGDKEIAVSVGRDYAWIDGEWFRMTQAPYINEKGRLMVPIRMIAEELGFTVQWVGNDKPITITR